jgi:signal peptidase I
MIARKSGLVLFLILVLWSCKGKLFRNPSAAMEETIMTGETFYVTPAGNFKKNDIVVFNFFGENYTVTDEETGKYKKEWQKWVKRLTAVSGDEIQLKDGEVYVNGKLIPDPPLSLSEYDVLSLVEINDFPEREDWQTRLLEKRGDTFHFITPLTKKQADSFRNRGTAVIRVNKRLAEYNPADTFIINPCIGCLWTIDNFGPLKIPSPGDTVNVDASNNKLYQNIPGIRMGKNTIQEKLYFVLGDNRHYSMDSRHIGFISHSKMYGVVK